MMAIATIFDGIPRARVDENRVHGHLAFFPVQILIMGDSSLWQTTGNSILSQLTKCRPDRLGLFYLGLG
jgi:hypothetical protein